MGELEKAFFSDFEGAALGAFKGAVFPEDIRNPSGGGAAGGESAAGGTDGALDEGVVDRRDVSAGAANDGVADVDAHVPAHYGDPAGEWRALKEGRGFTVVGLDVVAVRGADRRRWLHSLLSQALADIAPGASTEALLFSPSGHIENGAFVYDDGDAVWLLCDRGDGRRWADFLNSMVFTMRVEVNLREDLLTVGAFVPAGASRRAESAGSPSEGAGPGTDRADRGADGTDSPSAGGGPEAGGAGSPLESSSPGIDGASSGPEGTGLLSGGAAAAALEETALFVWRDPWPGVSEGGATYTLRGIEHPARGWRRVIGVVEADKSGKLLAALERFGAAPAGMLAWEAARVAGWRPRVAREADERALPHELDWLRTAVHLNKGCYRGQETVAKLVNLGRPPRRLVELFLEGPVDELPRTGDPVTSGGRKVGVVTSAVRHPEDGPVALALVRRALDSGAVLDVGRFRAGQTAIVDPEGKSSASPAERPGAEFRRARLGAEARPAGSGDERRRVESGAAPGRTASEAEPGRTRKDMESL